MKLGLTTTPSTSFDDTKSRDRKTKLDSLGILFLGEPLPLTPEVSSRLDLQLFNDIKSEVLCLRYGFSSLKCFDFTRQFFYPLFPKVKKTLKLER